MYNNIVKLFSEVTLTDINLVGGKNSSIGEMINNLSKKGINVPNGFAVTVEGFKLFLAENNLTNIINEKLANLNVNDLPMLQKIGFDIRNVILKAAMPKELEQEVTTFYNNFVTTNNNMTFAVRSSATAEDLADASFAGQQESYLHVSGIKNILLAIKKVFASLYNDRAISYRITKGFSNQNVYISVGVQQMVRSDLSSSGVIFTLDTESGFREVIFITSSYGLGEMLVQGEVNPDEFYVAKHALKNNKPAIIGRQLGLKQKKMIYNKGNALINKKVPKHHRNKFSITDQQIEDLARYALIIENYYGKAMDIEWGIDGIDNKIYILQARPETVKSNENSFQIEGYQLLETSQILAKGRAVGQKIATGTSRIIKNIKEANKINKGDIIITEMTDPNWEPFMKKAKAIVTNKGGRTCHAAIIARELGLPAIVGTNNATKIIDDNRSITVSCAEGEDGYVYLGKLDFNHTVKSVSNMPKLDTKIMLNIGNPNLAFSNSFIPNDGVGLARLEFIINNTIGVHPEALINFHKLTKNLKDKITQKINGYESPIDFYRSKLVEGITKIATAFYPKPVIVRMSDFKSNEYNNLLGGNLYEPYEENPMIGFRGTSRYLSASFDKCFELECDALKIARLDMGFDNIKIMIPFVRNLSQASDITNKLAKNGLIRGENNLEIIMMCEIPSNAILADKFLKYFDGFSIGSNDLTQLTLGIDRDSSLVAKDFNENDEAVLALIETSINSCLQQNKYIGICGQGPSDYPQLAKWLLDKKISSISLNPDTVVDTWLKLGG